jgi:hypothetical protein
LSSAVPSVALLAVVLAVAPLVAMVHTGLQRPPSELLACSAMQPAPSADNGLEAQGAGITSPQTRLGQ